MATVNLSLNLPQSLHQQADSLAQRLNLSPEALLQLALESFLHDYTPSEWGSVPEGERPPRISQGEVYWVGGAVSGADIPHPHIVMQEDVFNHSRIPTVVMCALTSNLKRASLPGNLLLEAGEANLPKASVAEVSKLAVVDKGALGGYIGRLSAARVAQILAGMRFLHDSFFTR